MDIYIVKLDGDDMPDDIPDEPVTAENCTHAAEIYVQEILARRACVDPYTLKMAACIWVSRFEAPEGFGMMKDAESTSVPRSRVPAWEAFLEGSLQAAEPDFF